MAQKLQELDKIEISLLKLLTKGIQIKEAGKQLGLSESKTYKISSNILKKLDAKNSANAIYIAYKNGIIK